MPSEIINFTQDKIEALPPAAKGFDTYRDKQEKGLVLLVTTSGVRTFYLQKKIKGKAYRIKIARYPDFKVKEAREAAIDLKNQIAKGVNPAIEKQKLSEEMTFKELVYKYINEHAKQKNRTWQRDQQEIESKAKHLYKEKLSDISKDTIQKLFKKVTNDSGKYAANRFLARLKSVFSKAIKDWGLNIADPTQGITKHKEKSRDRYVEKKELPFFIEALNEEKNTKLRDYLWLSLLTGARKANLLAMQWQYISFEDSTWYIPRTKNEDSQLLPLVPQAVTLLKERKKSKGSSLWVFPSDTSASGHLQEPKKVWKRIKQRATLKIWLSDPDLKEFIEDVTQVTKNNSALDLVMQEIEIAAKKAKIGLPIGLMDVRLHDLRRSLGSWMAHTGASQYIIGKSLNHKSQKATEVYARLSVDPVRQAMADAVNLMHGES